MRKSVFTGLGMLLTLTQAWTAWRVNPQLLLRTTRGKSRSKKRNGTVVCLFARLVILVLFLLGVQEGHEPTSPFGASPARSRAGGLDRWIAGRRRTLHFATLTGARRHGCRLARA